MLEKRDIEKRKRKKYQPVIKKKILRKKIIVSSFDVGDFDIAFANSSNDDVALDEVIKYKQENEDIEDIPQRSFVLTKLAGKKIVSYFVEQVVRDLGEGELEVKYYKRWDDTNKFILEKYYIYITDSDNIERKLPAPITIGQYERQAYEISFQVNYNAYNI